MDKQTDHHVQIKKNHEYKMKLLISFGALLRKQFGLFETKLTFSIVFRLKSINASISQRDPS